MPSDSSTYDTLTLALRLLSKELRRRVARHPMGHLLTAERRPVRLEIGFPWRDADGGLEDLRRQAADSLDEALQRRILHHGVFRPGRVYCLRCLDAVCEHSLPSHCQEVFGGYSPSGVPRFLDFGQWLLERQEPRIDRIYLPSPALITHVTAGAELTRELLPAFRDLDSGYHIHGQVAAGWYPCPTADGLSENVALSFQVISSKPAEGRVRFALNLIGRGPGEEPLENLFDRTGELPWAAAARWAQGVLGQIERAAEKSSGSVEETARERLEGMLNGLARRLERRRRARDRRTRHADQRHRERNRPTWKAQADAARARDEDFLFDVRRETFVVLGQRGRAHVFNPAGKLVTSIRYSPSSIDRRRKSGLWRSATAREVAGLRRRLAAASQPSA